MTNLTTLSQRHQEANQELCILTNLQKLSTIIGAVIGLAATSVNAQWYPARAWTNCAAAIGGKGAKGLREAHAFFNEVWGQPRLRIQHQSKYVAVCNGYIFGIANDGHTGWFEASGDRDLAALADPGTASECKWYSRAHDLEHYYFFSRDGLHVLDTRAYIRRCHEVENAVGGQHPHSLDK
ncbi:hypothetical protein BDP81DRAFT_389201 [Colletotrichum phormii]|uniref:Uncharacterized protein n=1 Tax=Colletotrichum phormii TaxID=359342 RepID=A0AAJ0A7D5_9PEZI|nr:uncharacterized protein BDP81DRAFT_389201 [Colletotrichum phormii]KAK1656426.1 hypothetical protein BDP81DRAFT_389201 [Colletotrichum phormii]